MASTSLDFAEVAARHGVELSRVSPPLLDERLKLLKQTLVRTDVPYPLTIAEQEQVWASASAGKPFGIGPFGKETVELGKYENFQDYAAYSLEDHLSWACLVSDQQHTKRQFACREYQNGEQLFEIGNSFIPDFYLLNARIYQQTRWQLATVNMIIPAELFFTCHSRRFFPVTTFMRPLEVDYLEEPDIGHDVAGHVATFTIPAVANVMKNHGLARDAIYSERDQQILHADGDASEIERISRNAEQMLSYAGRIYWFTVEFGLVMQDDKIRCFGAGILSSPGETTFSIQGRECNRILIDPSSDGDLLRLANTDYLISEFQKTYFISQDFQLLDSMTPERILKAARTAMSLPDFTWREIVPGDNVVDVGTNAMTTNEKYFRLMAGQPMDECLRRTAIRNLSLAADGMDPELLLQLKLPPSAIPTFVLEWFVKNRTTIGD